MGNNYKYGIQEIACNNQGNNIYGVAYIPKGVQDKMPVVIFSHEFGMTNQSGRNVAQVLAQKGIICYCFDFCGGSSRSKSDKSTTEMSIFTEKTDLNAVIDMVKGWKFVDLDKLFLLGASQGGMVSAMVANDREDEIKGLMLMYPAFCISDNLKEQFNSIEEVPNIVNFMGVLCGKIYCEDAWNFDIFDHMKEYNKDVLIIHGDSDGLVNISYSKKAEETYPSAELKVIHKAGHGFYRNEEKKAFEYILEYLEGHIN